MVTNISWLNLLYIYRTYAIWDGR